MNILQQIENDVKIYCEEYKANSEDNYDFWNEHIKFVYKEAILLAKKYGADEEIVGLGALLHDIALIKKVGTKDEHHVNGKKIANEILTNYNYSEDKKAKVLNCILNHRSTKKCDKFGRIMCSRCGYFSTFGQYSDVI